LASREDLFDSSHRRHISDDVLVTNLTFDVGTGLSQVGEELGLGHLMGRNLQTIDGPWVQQVKVHTISKIKKRIPEGLYLHHAAR
jgi:hypothetical protein